MPIKDRKGPLPEGHPAKGVSIVFGGPPKGSSTKRSAPTNNPKGQDSQTQNSDSASRKPEHRGTEQEVRLMNSYEEAVQRVTREHLERASREKKNS